MTEIDTTSRVHFCRRCDTKITYSGCDAGGYLACSYCGLMHKIIQIDGMAAIFEIEDGDPYGYEVNRS